MRFRHALAALLIGGAAFPASAQDAQSLIAKNLEARGGAAALGAIESSASPAGPFSPAISS